MTRLSGRAPYCSLNPSLISRRLAAGVTTSLRSWAATAVASSATRLSKILPTTGRVSAWNVTIASNRLINSGRIKFSNSPFAACALRSCSDSIRCEVSRAERKPSSTSCVIFSAPRLLVKMIIVCRKLTVRPLESVNCPSSRICKSILSTSGCAFSISSNNTTEYGWRRTRSVNLPPSS